MNQTPARPPAVTRTGMASALGELTIVARGGVVIGLYFPHHWYRPDSARLRSRSEVGFAELRDQIREYLAGARQVFDVPMATEGDERQQRVWELVRQIPYGETATYGELARQLADGTTPQEVGAAVARNPVCLLVPCHRVIGAGGKLTGYGGGLARKRFLLDLEADVSGRAKRLF
jgi:methylated-DNA-[protein]-cysteine S-methyltransferase